MLTEKENEKVVKEFESVLVKAGLKLELIYSVTVPKDNEIFKDVVALSFEIDKLPNAIYPHIGVTLYSKDTKVIGKIGFTKPDFFHAELDNKDPLFGPNRMYDVKFLKNFKNLLDLKISSDFYYGEKKYLESLLEGINAVINENKLEEPKEDGRK